MEALDTVMNDEAIAKILLTTPRTKDICEDIAIDLRNVAQAQAEISFKAGIGEGIRLAYEDMKQKHYVVDYDLGKILNYLTQEMRE